MTYEPRNFDYLIGLEGFSEHLLKNHFALYQAYVKNSNVLSQRLNEYAHQGKGGQDPEYAELKRRFGWEFNGMRLHEYYFGNVTKEPTKLNHHSDLYKKISSHFGSYPEWEKEFKAVGTMRGIGWAVLFHDPAHDQLINAWIGEHDSGLLAGASIILILDVFEHAFMIDYGVKKVDYIEAFFKAIDWEEVENRFMVGLNKVGISSGSKSWQ